MLKISPILLLLLTLSACTEYQTDEVLPPPVISFYKGDTYLGALSTLIYSDTTVKAYQSERLRVQFAAAAGIKQVLAKNLDRTFTEENFEDEMRFNFDVFCGQPLKAVPYTQVYTFSVTDLRDQTTAKTITIQFE